MTTLTIPNLDAEVERRLRGRAALSGRSIEDEARKALTEQVANDRMPPERSEESAWDVIARLREKAGGGADFEPLDRSEWTDRPVDFGE